MNVMMTLGKSESAEPEKKVKETTCVLNFNTGYLECYRCGTWFDYNGKILPAPIDFAGAVMAAFGKCHRRCYKSEKGQKLKEAAHQLYLRVEEVKKEHGISQEEVDRGMHQILVRQTIKDFMQTNGTWGWQP